MKPTPPTQCHYRGVKFVVFRERTRWFAKDRLRYLAMHEPGKSQAVAVARLAIDKIKAGSVAGLSQAKRHA